MNYYNIQYDTILYNTICSRGVGRLQGPVGVPALGVALRERVVPRAARARGTKRNYVTI